MGQMSRGFVTPTELSQKQIFLPFEIPIKMLHFDLPTRHVCETKFYLPTVLPSNCSCTNRSSCDPHDISFVGGWIESASKWSIG